jgi:hypothetical protein
MANRPREHVLETLSQRAFESAFPAEWTVQKPRHDYGLDAQVQPFENEKAASPAFFAQLKATDHGDGDASGVTITVKTERLREYLEASHPVMLVGFHAPTNGLFFAWVHHQLIPKLFRDEAPAMTLRMILPAGQE